MRKNSVKLLCIWTRAVHVRIILWGLVERVLFYLTLFRLPGNRPTVGSHRAYPARWDQLVAFLYLCWFVLAFE